MTYFIAVAEELHFGRAAERVHICQPPLSMQIKNLEEEIGARLLNRDRRNVSLTEAGKAFLEDAREILAKTEEATRRAHNVALGKEGAVSVGFIFPALDTFFPDAIREYRASYPHVELQLREMGTPAQVEALLSDKLDLGVIRLFTEKPSGLLFNKIVEEPYVLAAPSDHPLASKKGPHIGDLGGEPLILFPRKVYAPLYDAVLNSIRDAGGAPPIVVQETTTKATAVALVAAGIGLALVPKSAKKQKRKGVVYRNITGSLPKVELYVAWRQGADHPCVRNFVDVIARLATQECPRRG